MQYAAATILALILIGGFSLSRLRCSPDRKSEDCSRGISLQDIIELSEDQIQQLLEKLEKEESRPPEIGAMCYYMSSTTNIAEYICPDCGEKTLYSGYHTELVEWRLQDCRRLFGEIQAMTEMVFFLDERSYCQYCSSSGRPDPQLYLLVSRSDGHGFCNIVTMEDLVMLNSFLRGRSCFETSSDGQEPLRPHLSRLRELLGFPQEREHHHEA